jgi:4'-phosphopantetheinyl transferase EntD
MSFLRTSFLSQTPQNLKGCLNRSILSAMLGEGIEVEMAEPTLLSQDLYPEELQYIAGAVSKRKAEFATARTCARRALARLGVSPCALVPRVDRSPSWPNGVVGSIAHTTGCGVVAVTDASEIIGIGLDIELDTPLEPNLERMICTDRERRWLECAKPSERGFLGKLYFSAKESFYKCQYGITRTFLDFGEVEIEFDLERESFTIVVLAQQGPAWDFVGRTQGRFRCTAGFVITSVTLAAFNRANQSSAGRT